MYSVHHVSYVSCASCLCILCILLVYHVLTKGMMFWQNVCVALIRHRSLQPASQTDLSSWGRKRALAFQCSAPARPSANARCAVHGTTVTRPRTAQWRTVVGSEGARADNVPLPRAWCHINTARACVWNPESFLCHRSFYLSRRLLQCCCMSVAYCTQGHF